MMKRNKLRTINPCIMIHRQLLTIIIIPLMIQTNMYLYLHLTPTNPRREKLLMNNFNSAHPYQIRSNQVR